MKRPALFIRQVRQAFQLTKLEHYYLGLVVDLCNEKGFTAAKHKVLAERFGVCREQAGRIMRSLEAKGVLRCFHRYAMRNGVMRQISNVYQVMINFGDAVIETARKTAAIAKEVWEKRKAQMLRRGKIVVKAVFGNDMLHAINAPRSQTFDAIGYYEQFVGKPFIPGWRR